MGGFRAVLGIDPGSICSGWAYVPVRGKILSGACKQRPKDSFEYRRGQIRNYFAETLVDLVFGQNCVPWDIVAIEDPYSASIRTAKRLATIRTALEELVLNHGYQYITVTPAQWHASVYDYTGDRTRVNVKDYALKGAREISGDPTMGQDAADAYWVARYVLDHPEMVLQI